VDKGETVDNSTKVVGCEHRMRSYGTWIRNDATQGPPSVLLELSEGVSVVTLTNQTIYVRCTQCYRRLQELLSGEAEGARISLTSRVVAEGRREN
jgi:hypothetical protein